MSERQFLQKMLKHTRAEIQTESKFSPIIALVQEAIDTLKGIDEVKHQAIIEKLTKVKKLIQEAFESIDEADNIHMIVSGITGSDNMNKKLDEATEELNRTKDELSRTKNNLNLTNEELHQTKRKLQITEQTLEETIQKLKHTEKETQKLEDQVNELKEKLLEVDIKFAQMNGNFDKMNKESELTKEEQIMGDFAYQIQKILARLCDKKSMTGYQFKTFFEFADAETKKYLQSLGFTDMKMVQELADAIDALKQPRFSSAHRAISQKLEVTLQELNTLGKKLSYEPETLKLAKVWESVVADGKIFDEKTWKLK